jgi:glycosyltransferase involved in cell wall biosynthesis
MMIDHYFFSDSGNWSGGGKVVLNNLRLLTEERPDLFSGRGRPIELVLRNWARPATLIRPFALMPQNAWAWTRIAGATSELARLVKLRAASEISYARARSIVRISGAIPAGQRTKTSPVIHNTLDREFDSALFASEASAPIYGSPFVAFSGSASYKGAASLLAGFDAYRAHGGSRDLIVVGLDPTSYRQPHVHALPRVDRVTALSLMRQAEAVILPSLIEASPITMLEAMATNPRIIASRIVAHIELASIHDADIDWFDPRDEQQLALALSRSDELGASSNAEGALASESARARFRQIWLRDIASALEASLTAEPNIESRGR